MARAHDKEDWDLEPEQHLERAAELLGVVPKAGEMIQSDLERMAIAGRHSAMALAKLAIEGAEVVRDLKHLRNIL